MTTKKMTHVLMMALCAVALLATPGCRSGKGGGGYKEVPIEDTFRTDIDNPLPGVDFTTYPRVEGVNFTPVYFAYDNYNIPAAENHKIDSVVTYMNANANVVLVIEGHCDERGTIEYNLSLGEYRSQSVRTYMNNVGISPSRIQTVSYGKERPAVQGSGESAWSKNRRAEFALYRAK